MSEEYSFQVTYREAVVRRAVYAFVFHQLGGPVVVFGGFFSGAVYVAYLLTFGADVHFAGFITGLIIAVFAVIGYLFIAYLQRSVGMVKRMQLPQAHITLTEEHLTLASDLITSTLVWSTFTQIYGCEEIWLLLFSPTQYFSLPTGGVPPEALAFIRRKIPKYRSIVGNADGMTQRG